MSLTVLTLGSINLLDGTKYLPTHESDQGWDPSFSAMIAGLRSSDGARLATARIGETRRVLQIVCLGADYNTVRANANAIDAVLIQARNFPRTGTLVTFSEQDSSESGPDTWKVLAGLYRRSSSLRPSGLIEGVVTLHLTKA